MTSKLRDHVTILWPVMVNEPALLDGVRADWGQTPTKSQLARAAVQPIDPVTRNDVPAPAWDCWLPAATVVDSRCRIQWDGRTHVITGDVEQWGKRGSLQRVTLLPLADHDRRVMERTMFDRCSITRGSGTPVFNETTGKYETTQTVLYSGPCRVDSAGVLAPMGRDAGDQFFVASRVNVSVPLGTTGLAQGDLVTITVAADNPQIAGAQYYVRSVEDKSEATAVRLQCEETP